MQASAEDSAAAAPVLPAFPAPTEPPPPPPSSEAVYPRASSSFSLPPKPLLPSQASQLRLIVDEILEFPPDALPDPDTLPESSADDGALQLRARLVGLARDPRAQSFVSRLRFISAQFRGQKHRFLEILDPFGERRMLMLRVPQPGRFSRAERLRLAQRQASFFDHPRGGFAPGMRIIPANWRKYGASEEDVSIMHSGQPFLLHDLPPPCAVKNYPSIQQHLDVVVQELDRLTAHKFLEGPLLYRPYHVVPMMVVIKADGASTKVRVVFDCTRTGLNGALIGVPMTLDPLSVVVARVPQGSWLMKIDMEDAFYHWNLSLEDSEFAGIQHPTTGEYYRLRFLPFGASQSPAFQQARADQLSKILDAHSLVGPRARTISDYIDDFVLAADGDLPLEAVQEVFCRWLDICKELGVRLKPSKLISPSKDPISVLGVMIDPVAMTASVEAKKALAYIAFISEFLAAVDPLARCSRLALAQLTGKLQSIALLLLGGQALLVSLYADLGRFCDAALTNAEQEAWDESVLVFLSNQSVLDLRSWQAHLRQGISRKFYFSEQHPEESGFWQGLRDMDHSAVDISSSTPGGIPVFTSDASHSLGGAFFEQDELRVSFPGRECHPHASSNYRELKMALFCLKKWGPLLAQRGHTRVNWRSDNSTAVAAVRRQSSRVEKLRRLTARILQLAAGLGLEIGSTHIAGVLNGRADLLSRTLGAPAIPERQFEKDDWRVLPALFARIAAAVGPFDVDACADHAGFNAHCSCFWSAAESALLQAWARKRVWCNPSFRSWPDFIRHFRREFFRAPADTSAVFVLPLWEDQADFWHLTGGARVLAWFPEGSRVFDGPSVRLPELSRQRVDVGPVPFDVVFLWYPPALYGAFRREGGVDMAARARAQALVRSLPLLCGDFGRDHAALSALQAGVLLPLLG